MKKVPDVGRKQIVSDNKPKQFPLTTANFLLMAISAVIIVIGFLLMTGGGSTVEEFDPSIFNTRRVVIGPTIALLGFLFMGYAIIHNPKRRK
ncbi:MAG: DUF3098 domain-containing protein [Muribaculaceae bacterium]|nr:DUF3098 domain-containing protein [Muribaculaceae bacterium]